MKALLVLLVGVVLAEGHSPVVMWPASEFPLKDGQSALESMSSDNFESMVTGKNVVVFHKKTLSLEDLTVSQSPMSYLLTQDLSALQGVSNIHHLLKKLVHSNNLKFVELPGSDLSMNQEQMKKTMEDNPGYSAILVSSGSHKMSKRAAGDEATTTAPPTPGAAICQSRDSGCAIVYIESAKSGADPYAACKVTCSEDKKDVNIELTGEKAPSFSFSAKSMEGGFVLLFENATLEVDTPYAPDNFSYSCGTFSLYSDITKSQIILDTFQVYLTSSAEGGFPESFDCATWFTTSLWMGFVVVFFYLFILFVAMLFLYDIKTNDRFDDPKGKTITVNVSE